MDRKIVSNSESIHRWVEACRLKGKIIRDEEIDVDGNFPDEKPLSHYNYMIKGQPKPTLTQVADRSYGALQTICLLYTSPSPRD